MDKRYFVSILDRSFADLSNLHQSTSNIQSSFRRYYIRKGRAEEEKAVAVSIELFRIFSVPRWAHR